MASPLDFLKFSKKQKPSDSGTDPATDPSAPAVSEVVEAAEPAVSIAPIGAPVVEAAESGVEIAGSEVETTVAEPEPAAEAIDESLNTPRSLYAAGLRAVGKFFAAAAKLETDEAEPLPVAEIVAVAARLVDAMEDSDVGDELVAISVGRYPDTERFIVPHSVNVAVLSQRVARQLGLEGQELLTLAAAALVHDVGTVRIPKETFYKADSLTNDEWELMRQRPVHSHAIISTLGSDYRGVAEVAYQVHERLDGNGYPRALAVSDIALEASILGAVDIFEAFIHPRPYKKTVPAAAMYGVDNLMRMSHQFGDGVLKALVRSVGLFPVGTHVKLNSGEVARVLKGRPGNPMRPEVEVVFDTQSRKLETTRRIDLMATPHLYVFKPLSPEDLVELGL